MEAVVMCPADGDIGAGSARAGLDPRDHLAIRDPTQSFNQLWRRFRIVHSCWPTRSSGRNIEQEFSGVDWLHSSLRAKRSNPELALRGDTLDCFVASFLAMTRPSPPRPPAAVASPPARSTVSSPECRSR